MATECEQHCDQKKLNPAKVAELDWQDAYKLEKLIKLQNQLIDTQGNIIFGGVSLK